MGKSKKKKLTVNSLAKKAEELASEISNVRKEISQNESAIRTKISQKNREVEKLRLTLRKNFSSEKAILSRVKSSSARRQASLKQRAAALERVNKIHDEKKARISKAKSKQTALKNQLKRLESQVGW